MEKYIVSQLLRLISIPSVTGQEGDILFYIEEEIEKLALEYVRQKVEGSYYNILVGNFENPRWLICAHVDTVSPVDMMPPRATISDGFIYGLGACDDKAGVSILLALLKEFRDALVEKGVLIAFTVDEEKNGKGSKELAHYLDGLETDVKGAIVIEPTEMAIAVSQDGSIEVFCFVEGRFAHGSCLEDGDNAIIKAINLIKDFDSLGFLKSYNPLTGKSLYNVLFFSGGSEEFRVPSSARFLVDFRIAPKVNVEDAVNELAEFFKKYNVAYEFRDISPGFVISEDEEIVKRLKDAYVKACCFLPVIGGMKSWTDAENFYAVGIPTVIFGPGKLKDAHTPWENVAIDEIVKSYKVLSTFVRDL